MEWNWRKIDWVSNKIGYVPDSPDILQLTAGEYWDLISAAYELDTKRKRLAELTALLICIVIKMKQSQVFHMECVKTIWSARCCQIQIFGYWMNLCKDLILKQHWFERNDEGSCRKGKQSFSTHVLDTAQQLCDKLAILKKGELIYQGAVSELLNGSPDETLEKIYLKMAGRQATGDGPYV